MSKISHNLNETFFLCTNLPALLPVFLMDCIFIDSQQPVSTSFTGIYINILVIVHGISAY
jgi:hypothetical protein